MSELHKNTTTTPVDKTAHVPTTKGLPDELMDKSTEASAVLTKAQAITQSAKDLLNTAKKTVALAQAREKDPSAWLNSARDINDSFRNLVKTVVGSEKAVKDVTVTTKDNQKTLH